MKDAEEPDGGGAEKAAAPSEDTTVELRKSCDYCVRLKRACDGKNPCSLCSRRHKPCTRSARKKSGPAKGTKYAPRRKRSVIAEWADLASLGGKNPGLPPGFRGGGGYAVGLGGGGGGGAVGFGGTVGPGFGARGGGQLPHHFPVYPGDAAASAAAAAAAGSGRGPGMPYHGGRSSSSSSHPGAPGGRFGRDVPSWREDPLAAALSGHPRGRRPSELGRRSSSSSSSMLPLPMGWYGSAAHDGAEAEGPGAGMPGDRGLQTRLDPPPMGYAPTTVEELSRRHHLQPPSHRSAWSVSSLEIEGTGERPAIDPRRRRTWEPHPGEWGQSNPALRSAQGGLGTAQSKRVRLSPPGLPQSMDRPSIRPTGAEPYPQAELSPRERGVADHPAELPREMNPDLPLPFLPPPREPPDPMAGFSFHPAANRSTWRRVSHPPPWESPEGGGGRRVDREDPGADHHHHHHQQYAQQPAFFDPSDRPPSSWIGPSGGGGGGGAEYIERRRYHGSFRAETEAGQGRGDVMGWQPSHVEGAEAYRERLEIPPPPHIFDRQRPMERPLMGGGEEGDDRRHGAMMLLGSPPRPPGVAAAAAAARDDLRARQQMYARPGGGGGGDGVGPYERSVGRLAWPGGGAEQMEISGRGSRDPRDHQDDHHQQQRRLEHDRERPVPTAGREDWEGRFEGREVLQPPQSPPPEREAGGRGDSGRGAGAGYRWESERPEAVREEAQWRRGGGDTGGAFLSSSPTASRDEHPSQRQQREPEDDRGLNRPASVSSSAREAGGSREGRDGEDKEKEEGEEEEEMEHPEAGSRQRHPEQEGPPASPRDPVGGDDAPVP